MYEKIQDVARDVVAIQDASNLSGVVNAWGRMQSTIRTDAEKMGVRYEQHPANILMLSKIASLMRVNADCIGGIHGEDLDLFAPAYKWAKELSK